MSHLLMRSARRSRRVVVGAVASIAAMLVTAAPVAADPAAPTNYRSTVRAVTASGDAVRAEVVGGDSFLEVRVAAGHEVVVLGYENEPYLRIGVDGTVEENRRSPAVVLNQARYGRVDGGQDADATAAPEWRRVASGGTYVWHDHRIHWMSAAEPPQLQGRGEGKVFDWTVPIVVDGTPASIDGELVLGAAPATMPSLVLGVVAFAAFVIALRWRARLAAPLLAACALAAFAVSLIAQLSLPAAAGRQLSLPFTALVAAACALAAIAFARSRYAAVLPIAAALVLPLWIGRSWPALTNAVLPGDVAPALVRTVVVVSSAAVAAVVIGEAGRSFTRHRPVSEA